MRVNLSYSVELEDVPEHISQIIDDEWEHISFCDHVINEIIDCLKTEDMSTDLVIKKIVKVRRKLATIDTRLRESTNILEGYKIATEQSEAQPPSPEPRQNYNTPYEIPKESTK